MRNIGNYQFAISLICYYRSVLVDKHSRKDCRLKLHFNGLSPLAGGLFGLLSGIILCLMLMLPRSEQLNETQTQNYGNALATLAAHQAIDAAFNHDLVRLQVILSDIMENPHAQLATIHDVENNLLVQAGDSRSISAQLQTFTAPIVLHDSIAGYLSVTIDSQPVLGTSTRILFGVVILCLLALLVTELRKQSSFEFEFTPPGIVNKREQEDASNPNQGHMIDPDDSTKVYSIIHLKNLAVLQQQLNGENFRKTLGELEQVISDVLALYNGAGYQLEDDQFRLTFFANDATNEALFRATCSAWLIVELGSVVNNIPLDLAAFVSANHLDLVPANLPCAGLVLETQAAADELIARRLHFMDVGSDDGRKVVSGFEQPFQSLLERQRSQLAQL